MTLHPWLAARFAERARCNAPPRSEGTVAQARAQMAADRLALGAGPEVATVEDLRVPTRDGGALAVRRFVPGPAEGRATIVYLHGGGWVMGTLADYDALARALAARTRCTVLLVDYRLAPEHPFPAALEDAEDALRWAARQGATPLVLAGDSAGANLAAAVAATMRRDVPLVLQALLYPVTDADLTTPSYRHYGAGYGLELADMRWFLAHYLGSNRLDDPRFAVLRQPDLARLAPAWIAVAECDVLRDEGVAYAYRLRDAGVPATLREYAGMAHGFAPMFNQLDVAGHLLDDLSTAIDAQLSLTTSS